MRNRVVTWTRIMEIYDQLIFSLSSSYVGSLCTYNRKSLLYRSEMLMSTGSVPSRSLQLTDLRIWRGSEKPCVHQNKGCWKNKWLTAVGLRSSLIPPVYHTSSLVNRDITKSVSISTPGATLQLGLQWLDLPLPWTVLCWSLAINFPV